MRSVWLQATILVLMFGASAAFGQNYSGATETFPGCGNPGCHDVAPSPTFPQWQGTEHATAFDSSSGFVQMTARCLECHTTGWDTTMANLGADDFVTINEDGSVTVDNQAEFDKKTNVQCESCHGPTQFGVNHPPELDLTAENCGQCHQDEHHPYIEEWLESEHSGSHTHPSGFLQGRFRNDPNCSGCHTVQGFIQFVGTTAADTMNIDPDVADPPGDSLAMPIVCAACHDPHDGQHAGQLRLPPADLCIKCHNPEDAEPPDNPHHSTSSMFAGTGAAEFEGFTYRRQSVHQLLPLTAEQRCVACHVFMTPFDPGPPVVPAAVGHTFEPRLESCSQEGCHTSGLVDTGDRQFNHRGRQAFTDSLVAELESLLSQASSTDSTTDVFQMALFNKRFVENSGSHGVHNADYAEDILVSSIQEMNVLVGVEVRNGTASVPREFALHQNFPNPFNPSTTIRIDVPKASHVKVVVYNSNGQEVRVLVDERMSPKSHQIEFDASKLPSGLYVYRLVADDITMTKKMLLLK